MTKVRSTGASPRARGRIDQGRIDQGRIDQGSFGPGSIGRRGKLVRGLAVLLVAAALSGAAPVRADVRDGSEDLEIDRTAFTTQGAGERLDTGALLAPGSTTILFFHSPLSTASRALSDRLERVVAGDPTIAVRRLIIDRPGARAADLDSPLARQHGVVKVPWLVIHDETGRRVAAGDAALARVEELAERRPGR